MLDKSEFKNMSVFAGLNEDELASLADIVSNKSYLRGDVIYEEGKPGGQLYIIRRGQVSVSRAIWEGERQVLGNLNHGMSFGVVSLIDGKKHSATAIASTDTDLWVLEKVDFDRFAKDNPVCGAKVLSNLVKDLCSYVRKINLKFLDMVQYVSLDR